MGAAPSATLDSYNATGVTDTYWSVNQWFGLRYAKPPVRFQPPVAWPGYTSNIDATKFQAICAQSGATDSSEDCLHVNVWAPQSATKTSKLPVLAYIHGGGWAGGTANGNWTQFVNRSSSIGFPVIVVGLNYRLGGFGWLASSSLPNNNLGQQDQREALRWIQKYISAFGGDPTKVTLFGASAGAISIGLHLVMNNGNNEGLFRGAWMDSGALWPTGSVANANSDYNLVLSATGCSDVACLQSRPFANISAAFRQVEVLAGNRPRVLNFPWMPRVDGKVFTDTSYNLAYAGKIANVPFVAGLCDDEGTYFVAGSSTFTGLQTQSDVSNFWKSNYFGNSPTAAEMNLMLADYPPDPVGSPYGVDTHPNGTMTYKQQSSFTGDMFFQAPRRVLMNNAAGQNAARYAYQYLMNKQASYLGTYHVMDFFAMTVRPTLIQARLIVFVSQGNPNVFSTPNWPAYTPSGRTLFAFTGTDAAPTESTITDDFRTTPMNDLINLNRKYPL